MIVNDTLEGLARRLGTMPALKSAQVWQGPWDATQSPTRASLSTPAALVSLGGLQLVSLGHTIAGRRDLVTSGQRRQPPTAFQPAPAVRPLANVEIAVTLVSAAPGAGRSGARGAGAGRRRRRRRARARLSGAGVMTTVSVALTAQPVDVVTVLGLMRGATYTLQHTGSRGGLARIAEAAAAPSGAGLRSAMVLEPHQLLLLTVDPRLTLYAWSDGADVRLTVTPAAGA